MVLPSASLLLLLTFPHFLKQSRKTRKINFGRGRWCAPLPILPITSHPPFAYDGANMVDILITQPQLAQCSRMGAKLAHATASRDLRLVFFYRSNLCYSYAHGLQKKTVSVAPIISPISPPPIVILPPLRVRTPSPNVHPKACDTSVAGGGLGGGATAMLRRHGGEGHDGNDNDNNAAVSTDREDDKRLRR